MSTDFIDALSNTIANDSYTENGALGFKSTSKALLDFNFKIPSYRDVNNRDLMFEDLENACEDRYILKYLFYLRDIREGLGERDTFRNSLAYILNKYDFNNDIVKNLIEQIPEFGRYDDILTIIDNCPKYSELVYAFIDAQLTADLENMGAGKPISLLAKWLPSDNATSPVSRKRAKKIADFLGMSLREYRRLLVRFRKYLNVTETFTCANKWNKIDYNKVSSNANLRYASAFLTHDAERRREYLSALERGDSSAVIHSATNFPHDIVHKYCGDFAWRTIVNKYDAALEELWKNLPDLPGMDNTLVIRDGSASMTGRIPGSTVTAENVADALSIYCSARCKANFKDTFITFSSRPQLVHLPKNGSLHEKLVKLGDYTDCSSTNIKATFELILRTAIAHNLAQDDLPKQLLIISDMEFDMGVSYSKSLFEEIAEEFSDYGYRLPKLVFWNVNGRTNTIPLTQNEEGVILASGFSIQIINMINNGETDPYKALIHELDNERYSKIPLLTELN